jgi:AcrR family transcriptional regulator
VTERTFFRYFAGKEELILDDVLEWLPGLQSAIRDRPADEAPLQAVGEAVKGLLRLAGARATDGPLALFANGRPVNRLGTSGAAFVLRVENDVADAVAERLSRARADETGRDRFLAEVVARVSVAVFRSAMIRDVELRKAGCADRPGLDELYDSALASVTDVAVG